MDMKRIILEPSLDKCVETLAKQRFWARVDEYARRIEKEGILQDLELEIEALRRFLEEMDVPEYRRQTEELLIRGEKVRLVLEVSDTGEITVLMDQPVK
jgi:hypothetical protein